ncbi:ketopantoate reductase PanE/ApbA C terminal-domain-containing protein, partial [Rhizophagus diaphanus]
MVARWHVLGVGNYGSLFAHFLRKNGNKVTLLIRDPTTLNMFNKLNRTIEVTKEFESEVEVTKGYQAECLQGDYGNVIDPQYPNELCPPHLRISKLIVTLKSHEFSKYYQRIFHRLSPTSTIILFTYGLGSYEELMRDYYSFDEASRPNIIIALNSHHAYKKAKFGSQFKLIHSGFGEIDLGIVPRRFEEIKEKELNINSQIPELNARCVKYVNLINRKLENLALNAVIDPLTSIYSIRNGALLFNKVAEQTMRPICEETSIVIRKHREYLGMKPSNRFAPERLIDAVFQICIKTRHYESAMLQDVKKNFLTDIDYLNGYIVKLGKFYDIPTPINKFLIDMV